MLDSKTIRIFQDLGTELIEFHKGVCSPVWDEYIGAFIDDKILESATRFTFNQDFQTILERKEVEEGIKDLFSEIETIPHTDSIDISEILNQLSTLPSLKVVRDLVFLAIGSKPRDSKKLFSQGEETVSSRIMHFCKDIIAYLLKQNLESENKSREGVLELAIVLQVFDSFESVLFDLGALSSNYLPLCGIDNWMSDITELVDEYLEPEDIEYLEQVFKTTPLVAMHTKKLNPEWLSERVLKGDFILVNNPHIPAATVNRCLENLDYRQQNLLLHPNADKSKALSVALELLEDGDELTYLQEWSNVRDDGFNGFNSFRTSETAEFVIQGILEWCEEDPDERSHIAEIFES